MRKQRFCTNTQKACVFQRTLEQRFICEWQNLWFQIGHSWHMNKCWLSRYWDYILLKYSKRRASLWRNEVSVSVITRFETCLRAVLRNSSDLKAQHRAHMWVSSITAVNTLKLKVTACTFTSYPSSSFQIQHTAVQIKQKLDECPNTDCTVNANNTWLY